MSQDMSCYGAKSFVVPRLLYWSDIKHADYKINRSVIFQQCINFLVDTYTLYAASAVSANTFLRSLLACGFPLVARPMFHNLGVGPAMSILGAVACLALPVPLLFMKFGLRLRKMSKFAPVEGS